MTAVLSPEARARAIVASLRRLGSRRNRDGMARYAIPSHRAFGVRMSRVQASAKRHGRDHALALRPMRPSAGSDGTRCGT